MKSRDKENKGFFGRLFGGFKNPTGSMYDDEFGFKNPTASVLSDEQMKPQLPPKEVTYGYLEREFNIILAKIKKENNDTLGGYLAEAGNHNIEVNNYKYQYGEYITVINVNADPKANSLGWKIHVAIDQSDPVNVAKGTDIVLDILRKHDISIFKIARPGNMNDHPIQSGKHITIYNEMDPGKDWQAIIKEIQDALVESGVKAAPKIGASDRYMGDSKFITYRNDVGPDGRYIPAFDTQGNYNPSNKEDKFLDWLKETPMSSLQRP
jgi:hypothetical protein